MNTTRSAERVEPLQERLPRLFSVMDDQLELAVTSIDAALGQGYAERHPNLIAAVLNANALHALAEGFDERLLWIDEALRAIAAGAEQIGDALHARQG